MSSESRWYGDGTFKVAPLGFTQLYTINIIRNNKNVPMFYALLPDKKQSSYDIIFDFLSQKVTTQPKSFVHDLEKAALNSIKSKFPEKTIEGCYFTILKYLY